ncbi:hypothetical protein [Metallibacterium scheffleri]
MSKRLLRITTPIVELKQLSVLATALAVFSALTGCATLNQVGQQTLGPNGMAALTQELSTMEYKGQTWGMAYSVLRAPDGTYYVRKLPDGQLTQVGKFLSFKKVYSVQTNTFGSDVFLAPTRDCPDRYLMLIAGSNVHGHFVMLGCEMPLTFLTGSDGYVYATQATSPGMEPLAYRVGAIHVWGPSPIAALVGYPQRAQRQFATSPAVRAALTAGHAATSKTVAHKASEFSPMTVPAPSAAQFIPSKVAPLKPPAPVTVDLGGNSSN